LFKDTKEEIITVMVKFMQLWELKKFNVKIEIEY